jgi:hypothetical protein
MALQYVTLTLDLYDGQGNFPVSGQATFTPSAVLTDAGVEIVSQQPIVAVFHAAGPPAVKLLATDSTGPMPAGWAWSVTFTGITGAPAGFSFFLPYSGGASQLLSSLAPVSSGAAFQAYLPLPSGNPGSGELAVTTGSGTATAWEATSTMITAYGSLATADPADVLPIVDVDDTTMAPSGTTKRITVGNLIPATRGEALTSGEAILPRYDTQNSVPLSASSVKFTFWTASTTGTATSVVTSTGDAAASGLTLAKIGVYSVDGSGNLTLLASTADLHASLWTSTFTKYTSSLASSFSRVAGQKYALGCLAVGTTPPHLLGNSIYPFGNIQPYLFGGYDGQSDLPASVPVSSWYGADAGPQAIVAP